MTRPQSRRDFIWNFSRVMGVAGAYTAMEALGLVAEAGPYAGPPEVGNMLGAGRRVVMEAREMKKTKENADEEEWDVLGPAAGQ